MGDLTPREPDPPAAWGVEKSSPPKNIFCPTYHHPSRPKPLTPSSLPGHPAARLLDCQTTQLPNYSTTQLLDIPPKNQPYPPARRIIPSREV